ncbi:hypothetical protein ACJIZ3_010464 [Penstemon smallii]|uniref:Uncharacterized protein n=1 Tax=Penstemon smallii TaxID=265156 RepID=A0ABD3THV0_9LAMI
MMSNTMRPRMKVMFNIVYDRGLISKTWERCKSFSGSIAIGRKQIEGNGLKTKSKSWSHGLSHRHHHQDQGKLGALKRSNNRVTPLGCFSIYVGPERQRFVIKTEYVNHHLFKMLLEEAESEYGYSSEGPLMLPCEVSQFVKVLMEMDCEEIGKQHGWRFVSRSHSSNYHLLTPSRLVVNLS